MSLYLIQFDGDSRYVEAESFGEAIKVWDAWCLAEWGIGEEEPDSVALVSDDPVIRAEPRVESTEVGR